MKTVVERRSNTEIAKLLLDKAIYSAKDRFEEDHVGAVGTVSRDVSRIAACTKDIIESQRSLFSVKLAENTLPCLPRRVKLVPKSVGDDFLACLKIDLKYIVHEYPIVRLNPFVDLFYRIVYHDEDGDEAAGLLSAFEMRRQASMRHVLTDDELKALAVRLDEAVKTIRDEGRGDAFRKLLGRYLRPAVANYRSLIRLVRALQAKYHHLLVIRVDLSYLKACSASISYEDVRSHRIAFRRYIKRCKRLEGAYLGCVLKLEFGVEKGLHYHALVFVNGDVLHGDVDIARELGEHWKTEITKCKGIYFNCNAQRYDQRGIGSVRYHDDKTRHNLETRVAAYIAKPDFYIHSVKRDEDRTIWPSLRPKDESVRRGRKRGKIDATAILASKPLPSKQRRRPRSRAARRDVTLRAWSNAMVTY
ncbi:inovirus-type Gp2 protein [Trinickia dinghuensis]|uniref:Inovirus Gp2 family protein n=1 Tax=Trinickia dinghuensis TaxID=2291023 RepID=A0A3D8JPY5_9BURK|nr:inovirus-type Gp2 protein [Trinickia dinghuensis]RDU94950.1 inovirus Gp2 family protein [Trinickia dinghuensis]